MSHRARRRQAVATLDDQGRQAHALAAPAAAARARQQCLELTGSDGTHTSRAGARALDVSTGPSTHGHERRWAHPGKRSPGHSATTGHASEADRLFVFSTSAAPFQPGRPYSCLLYTSDAADEVRRV